MEGGGVPQWKCEQKHESNSLIITELTKGHSSRF